jgi:mRNA-degrading endonuclease RelE of RelBE toxin-antitoxin system
MPHYADPDFWRLYRDLPESVRELADKNFELLKVHPDHPSLRFKKVKGREGLWSARVGRDYRALAVRSWTACNGSGSETMPTMSG